MTTHTSHLAPPEPSLQTLADADVLSGRDAVAAAAAYVAAQALADGPVGRVGLELELHLVDLARPAERVAWADVMALVAAMPAMPSGSSVTLEPGGQLELSTPPHADVVSSVAALRTDRDVLRAALAARGYAAVPLGADPVRPPRRVNPHARYDAMERHFAARSCAGAGLAMMTATAALQVNLDAGPAAGWSDRLALLRSLVPVLVAASAGSPYLGGRSSGWSSMRQETWQGIDSGRSDPVTSGEPGVAWALYALDAPVMLVREGAAMRAITERVTFAAWLRDPALIGRPATLTDLDYHLTTLFPPVRPRGYVEIRCVDALPDRWWPAVAALVVGLVDDPVAADLAAELCEPVAGAWERAARDGVTDPDLRRAVAGCTDLAARRAPAGLRTELEALATLVADGSSPGQELRAVADTRGPLALLEEEARA